MAFVPAGCEAFTDDDQFDGFDFGDEQGYNYHEKDPPRVAVEPANSTSNGLSNGSIDDSPTIRSSVPSASVEELLVCNPTEERMRLAIVSGTRSSVEEILDTGFDPNSVLSGGWTALLYSCDHGHFDIIKLLLEKGANPNAHKDMFSCLMALCCSKNSNQDQLSKCAQLLIDKGARINTHDRHRMTPLIHACQSGHYGIVSVLLSFNADINRQDLWGWTPLCYAASQDSIPLVTLLLENGADSKLSTHLGDTPVTIALSKGFTTIVSAIEGGKTQHHHRDSETVRYGDLELFLAGLQLSHLSSLFQEHEIKFSSLLSMTEKDLENIGIAQVGLRMKLLDAIVDLHKTQWKMPTEPLSIKRSLSVHEYSSILTQLSSHIDYLSASTRFILQHTSTNPPSPLSLITETCERDQVTTQVQALVSASKDLSNEVKKIKKTVYKGLGKNIPGSQSCSRIATRAIKWTLLGSSFAFVCYCLFRHFK